MPQDTVWLNDKESFLVLDSNTAIDKATIQKIMNESADKAYVNDEAYYNNLGDYFLVFILICLALFIMYAYKQARKKRKNPFDDYSDWVEIGTRPYGPVPDNDDAKSLLNRRIAPRRPPEVLTYFGKDLNFTTQQIVDVLTKRFRYFNNLTAEKKNLFLNRHRKFLRSKTFRIHDKSGFKEMPILISATAIQMSLGLEEYMLPHYKNIHIFPQEFLGIEPSIRFLEGNVSGNCINISWKHYLLGYENSTNGQNVGLHEMAHAYYCQNMISLEDRDKSFAASYNYFSTHGESVLEIEKSSAKRLYSDYGLKNLQEFWAESVEVFFEKPAAMKEQYPDLYTTMCRLLNQQTENIT
ncbi:MAG: zinc-dependent peptidase [Ferruginibacter sp.]